MSIKHVTVETPWGPLQINDACIISEPKCVLVNAKRLERLEQAERTLAALEAAGVDNWEGYSEAMRSLSEDEGEED